MSFKEKVLNLLLLQHFKTFPKTQHITHISKVHLSAPPFIEIRVAKGIPLQIHFRVPFSSYKNVGKGLFLFLRPRRWHYTPFATHHSIRKQTVNYNSSSSKSILIESEFLDAEYECSGQLLVQIFIKHILVHCIFNKQWTVHPKDFRLSRLVSFLSQPKQRLKTHPPSPPLPSSVS